MVAIIMSNQNVAAYLPGSFPREHNTLSARSLGRVGDASSKSAFTSSRLSQ
jgi:hypothetical protein